MQKNLELIFLTDLNKKVKVVVPEPKPDVTTDEINQTMDLLIAKKIFGFPQGVLAGKYEARIVQSDVQKLSL